MASFLSTSALALLALQATNAAYLPHLEARQSAANETTVSNTCPVPAPLQTAWDPVYPRKNPKGDDGSRRSFGPPNVSQGKNAQGQPLTPSQGKKSKVRNFIFTLPDGFGPASQAFARDFNAQLNGLDWGSQLAADTIHIGSIRTRASDSFVTDSAAAATAYASAVKTYNGGIGVDEDASPLGTVLEAAKAQGFTTGMVVTSRITHASPAAFGSHSYDRDLEGEIASQLIGGTPLGHTVDLMLGGGNCYFYPNSSETSCRDDNEDLWAKAAANGYSTFTDRAGFDALGGGNTAPLPFLGLFTSGHMSYEVDRNATKEPSLSEMTATALQALKVASQDNDQGFFLFHEGSRIDHAGHSNDLVGHLHEILEWNKAVELIKKFVDENEDTVMIGAADHECGGLVAGGQFDGSPEYGWVPEALEPAQHSSSYLGGLIAKYKGDDLHDYVENTIFPLYGINDANSTEVAVAVANNASSYFNDIHIAQSLSRRAMVKWTTLGHSAVDVNLIGYPADRVESIRGNHENVELGQFMIDTMGLDVDAITQKLNDPANDAWLTEHVGKAKIIDGVRVGGAIARRADHHC